MTRINFGIDPKYLTDEHLLAEHREIKRITSVYKTALKNNNMNKIPKNFSLSKGHVLFFIDKPKYTLDRYKEIYKECINRDFNICDYSDNWTCYDDISSFTNTIEPTDDNIKLLKDRISERIIESKKGYFHYYKNKIEKENAIKLLK